MKKIRTTTRIWLLVAVATAAGVGASSFLVYRLRAVEAAYESVMDMIATQDSARQMQVAFKKQVQAWKDILIRGSNPADLQKYSKELYALDDEVKKLSADLRGRESSSEVKALIDRFGEGHQQLGAGYAAGLEAFRQAKGLNSKEVDATVKGQDRAPTDVIDGIVTLLSQRGAAARTAQAEAVRREIWAISLALLAVFGGTILISGVTVQNLSTVLRKAISELAHGAEQLAGAAAQVSTSSQSLAQGASEQAASIEEISASSEEIHSMARQGADNSRSAAELVTQSQQKFVETNQSLEQSVAAMGEISAQSGRISKIIKTIDEIAFQTNILALNAAVEAARAGEAGLGFAVVADEVRNLAQRCAQAARDTSSLIEESVAKSTDGKAKVDDIALAVRAITDESARVKALVDQMNVGSQEQARGIEQIGKAILQMEQVTQETAANAEESAAAAEQVNGHSQMLKGVVERLQAMVGGETSHGRGRLGVLRKSVA